VAAAVATGTATAGMAALGTPTYAAALPAQATSTSTTCTTAQLFTNPGFESGDTGWTTSSTLGFDPITSNTREPAHTGSYKAWFNGNDKADTDTLEQTFTLPAGCNATVSYWQHIDTTENTATAEPDIFKVQVLGSAGTFLSTLATYSNLDSNSGYVQKTFDLSAYAGQSIKVKWTGIETNASGGTTDFVIDDTALQTSPPGGLDPRVAPGGNFDLSLWELQLPTGSSGSPTTVAPAQLEGPNGFQDSYFHTSSSDGAMTFWDPENGVTTTNSNFPRSELREMTSSGAAANWFAPGTHTMTATLRVTQVPDHVCVGQVHLGSGGSSKPLFELFYYANGDIEMAIEQSPAGGNEVLYNVGNVPLGTQWSYVLGVSGSTISLVLNGGAKRTWTASSSFNGYGLYFKAGDYDQSSGSSSSVGARVGFYSLSVHHGS
jgi:hypothetical protein